MVYSFCGSFSTWYYVSSTRTKLEFVHSSRNKTAFLLIPSACRAPTDLSLCPAFFLHRKLLPGCHMTYPHPLTPLHRQGLSWLFAVIRHLPCFDCTYHTQILNTYLFIPSLDYKLHSDHHCILSFSSSSSKNLVRCSINFFQINKFTIIKNSLKFLLVSKNLKMKAYFTLVC